MLVSTALSAQEPTLPRGGRPRLPTTGIPDRIGNIGNTGARDSLRRRDKNEDSITIWFRYLDSSRHYKIDSSVSDFTSRFPIPATHVFLGNTGTATRPILFEPQMKPGWDPGFHSFDVYKLKMETVPFYNTTRPYTELGYTLGSRVEQVIDVFHTQNIRPNWNGLFRYRLINSPGFLKNQKTNHNNYLLSSWYESVKKRYNNFFVVLANHMQSAENGGIANDQDYLEDPVYKDRFNIPTQIGGDPIFGRDFFSTRISTGSRHREFSALMRQQYDFGKKDSIVTDSLVIPLFFPRVRFEHTVRYNSYSFRFLDHVADSAYYSDVYGVVITPGDSLELIDRWKEVINEFSIYQFPDARNLQQFIRVGASVQNLSGSFTNENVTLFNAILFGEYRNRTRNQRWDMELLGKLYPTGYNAGDYHIRASLQRISPKLGYLQLGFENTNRKPSFLFDTRSSFYLDIPKSFNNENTIHLFGSFYNPAIRLRLSGHYYLVSNYTYFTDYYKPMQESSLFNFLRVSAEKVFRLGKHFFWYADVHVQQKTGNVQLNFPQLFTRNRIAFEGNFYTNLVLSTGFEVRYHTPYKADGYSPVLSKFFFQDSLTIKNLPEISFFMHLRIKSFKAYVRIENLNTVENNGGSLAFTNNNLAAPGYPTPGLVFRLGIYWNFIN